MVLLCIIMKRIIFIVKMARLGFIQRVIKNGGLMVTNIPTKSGNIGYQSNTSGESSVSYINPLIHFKFHYIHFDDDRPPWCGWSFVGEYPHYHYQWRSKYNHISLCLCWKAFCHFREEVIEGKVKIKK